MPYHAIRCHTTLCPRFRCQAPLERVNLGCSGSDGCGLPRDEACGRACPPRRRPVLNEYGEEEQRSVAAAHDQPAGPRSGNAARR